MDLLDQPPLTTGVKELHGETYFELMWMVQEMPDTRSVRINISEIEIPFLRTREEWTSEKPPAAIEKAQEDIYWAEHIVIIHPLWAGMMLALLKAFFEQVFRPGFAIGKELGKMWLGLLRGKSARVIVTMGMPAWFYRYFYLAHGLKSLERNILRFSGISSIKETLIGSVEVTCHGSFIRQRLESQHVIRLPAWVEQQALARSRYGAQCHSLLR